MAHFRATVQGNRGEASRLGTKGSGINAHIDGWNSGIRVVAFYNEANKRDEFSLYFTSGSNGYGTSVSIGRVYEDDKGNMVWVGDQKE